MGVLHLALDFTFLGQRIADPLIKISEAHMVTIYRGVSNAWNPLQSSTLQTPGT